MPTGLYLRPRYAAGALTLAIIVAVATASMYCGGDNEASGDLDENFIRAAATVEAMGLPVYWLGREFTAGDMRFGGPYVASFGAEVEGGGVSADYLSWAEGEREPYEGLNVDLQLTTYSRDAWARVEDRMMNPRAPGVTRRDVLVAGHDGALLLETSVTRPLNALWLILDLGDAVVVADAHSGGPVTPSGPDHSPFINNPDLLVQVMEDLRPYPK
jgi:hypothetical protein